MSLVVTFSDRDEILINNYVPDKFQNLLQVTVE